MELKQHQIECVNKIREHLKYENKALIKMFCGAGKSFIIYHSLLEFGGNLSVVVVPSINLITQFNRDYLLDKQKKTYNINKFNKQFKLITICSKNELGKDKTDFVFTTEDDDILKFIEQKDDKIVLITYQSLEKLINIVKNNKIKINLLCFDEAHHILGDKMKEMLFGDDEDEYDSCLDMESDNKKADLDSNNKKVDMDSNNKKVDIENYDIDSDDDKFNTKKYDKKKIDIENYDTYSKNKKIDIENYDTDSDDDKFDTKKYDIDSNNSDYDESITPNVFIDDCVDKTLFFTATPQNKNGVMMYESYTNTSINGVEYEIIDDEDTTFAVQPHCGKMIFEYMHTNGVRDGILNDFKIRVDLYTKNTDTNVFDAISRSILETGNNRVLTFHSRSETESETSSSVKDFSKKNKNFIECFNRIQKEEFPEAKGKYKNIEFVGITAKTKNRSDILKKFDECNDDEIFVLASCRTIGEGVDTKRANMVCFVDPKQSYIEIVQNIGRICRKNDRLATVLLPAYVDAEKYKSCNKDHEKIDDAIRKDMSKTGNFNGILNVLSALRQEDPYTFELCLKYSEVYTQKEISDNLKRKGLILSGVECEVKKVFEKNDLKYRDDLDEKGNFERLANKMKSNIQIVNQKISKNDVVIDIGHDKTTYFVKTDGGKLMGVENANNVNDKVERVNRNIKPIIHTNNEIKVLWGIDGEFENKHGVFGGFIKATVVESGEDYWFGKLGKAKGYINENEKRPSRDDKNIDIKKLGNWLSKQQQNYFEKKYIMTNKKIRKEWEEFAKEYKKYFSTYEETWRNRLNINKKYIIENKKKPSRYNKNSDIKKLGVWLSQQQINYSKKKRIMTNEKIRKEWKEFTEEYSEYFLINKEIWRNNFNNTKKYIEKNEKRPSCKDKNSHIKKLGDWLSQQQKNYSEKKRIMTNKKIRKEWEDFTKEYKKYFLTNEETRQKNFNDIKKHINENDKKPSRYDKKSDIKKLGTWIETQQTNYSKKESIIANERIKKEWEEWEEFITEYQKYFPNNPAIQKQEPKVVKKSTTIKPKEEPTESHEQKRIRIQSEYQELSNKMAIQKSENTNKMFSNSPKLWHQYHNARDVSFSGYKQSEVPVNIIITYLETKKNHTLKILDLGCGRNLIYHHFLKNKKFDITGYDHVAFNNSKQADISDLPEKDESTNICVYSQSLMGSNWKEYLNEGRRVLGYGGEMIISESFERYEKIKDYLKEINMFIKREDYSETKRWFYIHATKE